MVDRETKIVKMPTTVFWSLPSALLQYRLYCYVTAATTNNTYKKYIADFLL